ncbi:PP2C family serine/threonine-protein phosphatase [uncultured Umboniibacter sp.]|uniref:PP2C family protein-serine/threonine phosphatase n=1 Tax=uncultured Umboniibacter sp. TaxID=1798917 RepID=UPI002605DFE1|nr:PP2C family serine/threonine-protein phosphatase [uncultured Umboniibacter sp.]
MAIYYSQRQGDRDYQEDRFATIETDTHQLLIVADGLGGHEAGEVAAKLIIELVTSAADKLTELSSDDAKTELRAWFNPIVSEFQHILASNEQATDAHSTVAIAIIQQDQLFTLTVGDSRIYLCSDKALWRTRDHSVVQMLLDEGEIDDAEMADHPEQGKLYQSIGPKKVVKPRIAYKLLQPKDVVLAVSDGFWEGVNDDELTHFATVPSQQLLDHLVEQACERKAPKADNTTAIAYYYEVSETQLMKNDESSTVAADTVNEDGHPAQIPKDAERSEAKQAQHDTVHSGSTSAASVPTDDRYANDVASAPMNRRRDRLIALALVLFVIVLVVWGGNSDEDVELASSESNSREASSICMIEEVYEAQDNGIRIVLTSIDDGSEQIVSLPIPPGKYRVKLEDRNGECQDLRDKQGEIELKRKFERQLLRSSTVSMEVL